MKECISDLDCDRSEAGIEQVCSENARCVDISPNPVEACSDNSQCDGAVEGAGVCWDEVCRYRPPCLRFDASMTYALGCGAEIGFGPAEATSNYQGHTCVTGIVLNDLPAALNLGVTTLTLPVQIDSLAAFSEEGDDGRALEMNINGVIPSCEDGTYRPFGGVGRFATCTLNGTQCTVVFRALIEGDLCEIGSPCDDGGDCGLLPGVGQGPTGICASPCLDGAC